MRKLVIVICWAAAACAPGSAGRLEGDLYRLERSQQEVKRRQADMAVEIAGLEETVRTLGGRLDELEHRQRSALGRPDRLTPAPSPVPQALAPFIPSQPFAADRLAAGDLPQDVGLYLGRALAALEGQAWAEALNLLERGIALEPTSQEAKVRLYFWQGVTYEGWQDNIRAIAAYNQVVAGYPRHERSASALWQLANIFNRIGDARTAKITLEKLLADFPAAAESAAAQRLLLQL